MARIGANNRIEGGILFEREAVVDLPTGQVRALNGTARALVPAPGTGLALVPISLTATMLGATAFGGISTSGEHHSPLRRHYGRQGDTGAHGVP